MKTNILIRIAALGALLLSAAACVFPYEVELEPIDDRPLVIEGDIHIGGMTCIQLSRLVPVDAIYLPSTNYGLDDYTSSYHNPSIYDYPFDYARGTIIGEDGSAVEGETLNYYRDKTELTFDTSHLRKDQRYRLHLEVKMLENEEISIYETDWITVNPEPVIDALTFDKNDDFKELWIRLSMHCNGSHYFRWNYVEEWEYHSDIQTSLTYDPWTQEVGHYKGPSLYYCWDRAASSQIHTFSTAYQTDDRFEDLSFHTVPLSDIRLQVMYRVTITLTSMSKDAYAYWENVRKNTEGQGSILAPTPSQMASNLRCVTDPSARVIGYVDACSDATGSVVYDDGLYQYYNPGTRPGIEMQYASNDPDSSDSMYKMGYLPVAAVYGMFGTIESYAWAPSSCVDCRLRGGSKEVPQNWPSGHN